MNASLHWTGELLLCCALYWNSTVYDFQYLHGYAAARQDRKRVSARHRYLPTRLLCDVQWYLPMRLLCDVQYCSNAYQNSAGYFGMSAGALDKLATSRGTTPPVVLTASV
eukprot:2467062-Rhodomonas_salina.1